MYERRRARILLAILALLSLVLLTVDYRAGDEGPLAYARDGVATVFSPLQDGVATVVRPVGRAIAAAGELVALREENERLRRELEQLRERHRSLEDAVRENRELKELLELRDRTELTTVAGHVIALTPSNFEWTATIDVGARDGAERGMVVVSGSGLVGRIIQVSPTSSRVLLAVDPNFGAAVRVARTGELATVHGGGRELMRLELLDPESDVQVGDEIVTASYAGGLFPDGVPVGAIADVGDVTGLLTRHVTIRPYVDFTRLGVVLVVVRFPDPPPAAPDEEVPPGEPGDGEDAP